MQVELRQRGRALMDFEVSARHAASRLHREVEAELAEKGFVADALPDDMDERHDVLEAALADSKLYGTRVLMGEWCAHNHGLASLEAFEEIRDEVTPRLAPLAQGPTTITVDPNFKPPSYYSRVWFHRTQGGWDDNDYQGFVHAELTHKKYVAKVFPGDIYGERRRIGALAPRRDYKRVLEFGTSSGHYTKVLSEMYPQAEIVGLDPSLRMLEQAQRVANEQGLKWNLFVGVGEEAPFEDNSFDFVTSYAIHHELPPRIIKAWFKEAMRVLKPGGDILFSDVARTYELDKMRAWFFDWVARWQGEPYWRPTAAMDFAEGAREAGFFNVEGISLEPNKTYAVRGTKPA
jgi:SAM-dependent methyltransferase